MSSHPMVDSRVNPWRSAAGLIAMLALAAWTVLVSAAAPDPAPPTSSQPSLLAVAPPSAVISVWGRDIAVIRTPYEKYSVQDRAVVATRKILAIPSGAPEYKVEAVPGAEGAYKGAWIRVNGERVFGVITTDADSARGESFDEYTANLVRNLQAWLEVREEQYRWPRIIRGALLTLAATAGYALAMFIIVHYSSRWFQYRQASAADPNRTLKIRDLNIRPYLITLEIGLYRLLSWGIGFAFGYLWLTFILKQFPYSQPWGHELSGFLFSLVETITFGILKAIPDLFTVVVILLVARLFSKVVQAFFVSAERGLMESAWLEPETARATRRLVKVLIWVFALIIAYPYIPGSDTEAFKGVSVFLGLMVSLGSAGMVGQVVGGLVVVYTRAFQTGDHIKVGDHEGVVREIGVLSTKIETRTREEITIPNAVLLAATTVNYSRLARKQGAALVTTKLTIGYDAPWRQVHAMLETAAGRTAGVKQYPPPRVLQSALSDFYPEYTLIVAIDRSEERYAILSELHANIQDVFNEYGVQIMSPNFESQPEQPVLVERERWFEAPAKET